MVIDEVWRELPGVEPLSNAQGGPLSRTVKLILDPLVIRPVLRPECAGPLVDPDGARLLAALLRAAGDVLRATAAWFSLFKQVRRALRITEGNPQDRYFQTCFQLATTAGAPDRDRDELVARRELRRLHDSAAGRTTAALRDHLASPAHRRELTALLDTAWAARGRRDPADAPAPGADAATPELIATVLNAGAARSGPAAATAGDAALARLVSLGAGRRAGQRLWHAPQAHPVRHQHSAQELGLTAHALPGKPRLGGSASTAALGPPLDRTVHERVFTVLHAASDRAELPDVAALVRAEITRCCAPWALADETLRVGATVGVALAVGLRPLDPAAAPVGQDAATEAHRLVNRRWRRESYVLRARRLTVAATPAGHHLADDGPLARIAAELHAPWRAYLRRLWVRLHGRDVRGVPLTGSAELWDVLDGVARSVILDHRARLKRALSVPTGTPPATAPESRAG
ncbi:hypothetical protein LX83_000071 [Goodfellowiella coeruleoviolacea]|uniref:Uncharacterized protein n=2 Tax=Goodfellowiella coeruleoviolacea TaxID=334858 RepID=A0AAE3G7N9_9PSEU|nr:hypothetical protein [Goodfellowiella coeruleoviolacea]